MNMDECHYHLTSKDEPQEEGATLSPSKADFQRNMKSNLFQDAQSSKILAFKQKAPAPMQGFEDDCKTLFSANRASGKTSKVSRYISQQPDRVLDAPELKSDFYLNLLDWSSTNIISIALGEVVYLWNAANGAISELCQAGEGDYISSVSWLADGTHLAIGTNNAQVQIWDVAAEKRLRTLTGHEARVAAMDWNEHILSTGSKSGAIFNHDVRVQEHVVARLQGHSQEVCGLKWSPDGKQLASGGNDNIVNVWSNTGAIAHSLTQHQAAVKALAWCPWQANLLVSGGGTADRHLRFWNTQTGACINSVDTKSQISSVLWSAQHRELISGHGFSQNQLTIWKYPTMSKVTELTGHTERVLGMAMSPDGSTVVSASGDETLRFWKCFATDAKKKSSTKRPIEGSSRLTAMIR